MDCDPWLYGNLVHLFAPGILRRSDASFWYILWILRDSACSLGEFQLLALLHSCTSDMCATWLSVEVVSVSRTVLYMGTCLYSLYYTSYKRIYRSRNYHYIQEIQKFNLPDYRPRMDRFQTAVNKVRRIQRLKQSRGFAFSQNEGDQGKIIRMYDTTRQKPSG